MIVETRKTAIGTEYWDAKEKRIRFVPAGVKPDFEVTENPKSMVIGKDNSKDDAVTINLEDMTIKELKAYASELEVEIPSDVTKKEDIIKLLSDSE
ncbi:Rho termination factor N-terminal domain-containing protein [Metabacillus litoralis]|uniref:Rho termination factor N-terminal domain-containing protein n=1 Tax=Metabacillus litoralis TaxID=152268 RepID=UPI0020400092|nr:Rho termination factor N-terminal domain-containing protein [Metabacillus litoralis]MCM3411474.1 Rho termination factor N-terminal domain-containing protein [Metabacillus litoralis]